MATRKTPIEKANNPLDIPDRFKLGEMGNLGLKIFNGVSQDEYKRELNWPQSVSTYKEMSSHSTVNSPLTLFENIIGKATWSFIPPKDATDEEKNQCEIIESMMKDMDHSWSDFIKDTLSANIFGFSVHEKVYRKRYKSNGSIYDDGLIGWKKLPIRAQESLTKFIYSDDGNEIIGVKQNLSNLQNYNNRFSNRQGTIVNIPKSKFLHFRVGRHRGDPFGKSPLRDAYLAWRYLVSLEELEAVGSAKDLNGLPVLFMPAQYLSKDASPDTIAIRQYYENAMRNLQMNTQSAMILPQIFDPDTKQSMFKLELLSVDGKKNFDLDKIKTYYKNLIFVSLFADLLQMGQSATGSFALGAIKNSLSGAYAERLLSGITEVLQNDLIRQTYSLNNWDISRMGTLDFDGIEEADLETLSKGFQRMASTGLIEVDREVLNAVREAIGVDPLPDDLPPQVDILSGNTSRSGDGMAAGGVNGTSSSVSGADTSSNNADNPA